ncbi:hypothetical protein I3760_11G081600 [Carya illinoinensis]|nr:hypothetical protein I3760_11G081600 [Carya illinoinensis]
MPTKTGTYSKEKSVLLKVYGPHHHHHHHHHHLHQTIRREVILYNVNAGASSKGYDGRAQLLQYSRQLRLAWTSGKIKAITKSLQMQKKKRGFISGCINSTVGKSRS